MHSDPTWHADWLWMHLGWWVFWVAMAAIVWFIINRSTKGPGGETQLSIATLAALTMATSCRLTPPPAPVPVQGTHEELTAISGEWAGRYWSKATGRHGTIRFTLPEHADTGFGEVEITFSPSLRLSRAASAANDSKLHAAEDLDPNPCTVIDITLVKVETGRIRGTMAPYWDPDCDYRARTVFEGKISGNRITGSFSSRRESSDRRILTGQWQVDRDQS